MRRFAIIGLATCIAAALGVPARAADDPGLSPREAFWYARHQAMVKEIEEEVRAAGKKAEALGTLDRGPLAPVSTMFEDVYKEMPWYLERQRKEQEG